VSGASARKAQKISGADAMGLIVNQRFAMSRENVYTLFLIEMPVIFGRFVTGHERNDVCAELCQTHNIANGLS
jgi:hypothetical protein